jgi:hypothetical protein
MKYTNNYNPFGRAHNKDTRSCGNSHHQLREIWSMTILTMMFTSQLICAPSIEDTPVEARHCQLMLTTLPRRTKKSKVKNDHLFNSKQRKAAYMLIVSSPLIRTPIFQGAEQSERHLFLVHKHSKQDTVIVTSQLCQDGLKNLS